MDNTNTLMNFLYFYNSVHYVKYVVLVLFFKSNFNVFQENVYNNMFPIYLKEEI